jgi:lysozyme
MAENDPYQYMDMTRKFEGYRDKPYKDTKGKTTIGYGFNIDDPVMAERLKESGYKGGTLTQQIANKAFENAYTNARFDAVQYLGADAFNSLDPERQAIVTDMTYNMGLNKISKFENLRDALQAGDYNKAAKEMINSNWYKQVGNRSKQLVAMMR